MENLTHKSARLLFKAAVNTTLTHVNKDRQKGLNDLIRISERFMGDSFDEDVYAEVKKIVDTPDCKWMNYINTLLDEINPHVLKMAATNFIFEAILHGTKKIRKMRTIHECNIPWVILIDPTSACNLHCSGCWACEYGKSLNLTYEELDNIVIQGKELGIYFYMFTGGEPLIRSKDILKLCRKHQDCEFHAFTNGTLIDENLCKAMCNVGNLSLSLSLEGFEEVNDLRRGKGVFQQVLHGMQLLQQYGLIFGTSICYTSKNVETVTSDDFLDLVVSNGCRFIWYFHYMPVGNDAQIDLLPSMEQRSYMYSRVREIRSFESGKAIYAIDFQNDGEYVGGCIAGGRNYLHINPNGDIEPCVFIHYSGANIRNNSLLEGLKQPLFMAYRERQPFNHNHLKPCPMLENPEILEEMVYESQAHSTDLQSPEPVEKLCAKCHSYARLWNDTANELWNGTAHKETYYKNYKKETVQLPP